MPSFYPITIITSRKHSSFQCLSRRQEDDRAEKHADCFSSVVSARLGCLSGSLLIDETNAKPCLLVPPSSDRQYFFHLSTPSSLLPLSWCDSPATNYQSSSGFAILRSTPRLYFAEIDKQTTTTTAVSLASQADVVPPVFDPSFSTDANRVTLMSPPPSSSSNDGPSLAQNDYNVKHKNLITTSKSLPSGFSSTAASNTSSLATSLTTTYQEKQTFQLLLLLACLSAGILVLILIIYALIKYRNRDEGSYKIDESQNFVSKAYSDTQENAGKTPSSTSTHHRQKLLVANEQRGLTDSREWYV